MQIWTPYDSSTLTGKKKECFYEYFFFYKIYDRKKRDLKF